MARRGTSDASPDQGLAADAAQAAILRGELERLQREVDEHVRLNAILADSAEQFISMLAHDLKNPLAAIKVNVQGLKRSIEHGRHTEPEFWIERLGRVEVAVEQTLQYISAARARVSSSAIPRRPLERETIDLVVLAKALVDQCRQMVGQHRIRMECRSRVLVGTWDPARVREALQAVLDNALKFSSDSSPITLKIERDKSGDAAVLLCKDRGIGIPARDVEHVCERFYRGENVVGRYRGAGLGLFDARAAMAANGGSLSVESAEGSGSTITMRLPLH